jgi:hypothetical protein
MSAIFGRPSPGRPNRSTQSALVIDYDKLTRPRSRLRRRANLGRVGGHGAAGTLQACCWLLLLLLLALPRLLLTLLCLLVPVRRFPL